MKPGHFNNFFNANRERIISEWQEFLSIPSISADSLHNSDCIRCAAWLARQLERLGFKVELLSTPGKPVVYGSRPGKGSTSVLYYGHYDVQPVDPIDLWSSPPFSPVIRNGRMYARGAEDNKGQSWYFIKALEAVIATVGLDVPVKVLLEGEEECGSKGILACASSWKDKLKADILMVCDTEQVAPRVPTITMGLRGLVYLTARLGGLKRDLHSGMHGGVVKNPALELARLLATLHNADGSIAVKGYYDEVKEIDLADRALANAFNLEDQPYKEEIGAAPVGGEPKFSAVERRGFRPTIEVNGIHSGYGGPGTKTIIPAVAEVKLTSRLVEGQDPAKCLGMLVDHLKNHAPTSLQLDITEQGVGGPALLVSSKSKVIQRAKQVLENLAGREAAFTWTGGSIPVVSSLAQISEAEPLLVGFGLEEDAIHAPNESFSLEQFEQGFNYVCAFLSSLSSGSTT